MQNGWMKGELYPQPCPAGAQSVCLSVQRNVTQRSIQNKESQTNTLSHKNPPHNQIVVKTKRECSQLFSLISEHTLRHTHTEITVNRENSSAFLPVIHYVFYSPSFRRQNSCFSQTTWLVQDLLRAHNSLIIPSSHHAWQDCFFVFPTGSSAWSCSGLKANRLSQFRSSRKFLKDVPHQPGRSLRAE